MQVECEVFSRFASSVDFSSGGPLVGVVAPTVGADLCVRPSSPERSLFCGRTRRSAPTQATSARQFHSSNAVTPISVGTHGLCVRCRTARQVLIPSPLTGTDAQIVRPYRVSLRLVSSRRTSVVSVGCYNNLEPTTYRCGTVSGKTDFHVEILKYPGGEFLFSTWGRKNSSEESNETSEEMNHAHVENKKYPRGDLRFSTWIFEKGG